MQPHIIAQAAALIADARQSRARLEHLPAPLLPTTSSDALALLVAVSERLQLDIGSYEVGATSPAALNRSD
jgi:hypothetical protein